MFAKVIPTTLAVAATVSGLAGLVTASPVGLSADKEIDLSSPNAHSAAAPAANSGKFTYHHIGLGVCGRTSSDGEMVVALGPALFDPQTPNGNPNNNPLCGRRLRASHAERSVEVTVVDRCPVCGQDDLDLSPTAFQALASLDIGAIQGTWEWI